MLQILTHIARFLVGSLFIFSGLIKANDPKGTAIKLEEYFEVFSNDKTELGLSIFSPIWSALVQFALPIAIILIVLEVVVGIFLLIGYKPKLTVYTLAVTIVFFTFLTFYSAFFNKVTDCGCFGDAFKLTPWQSFQKDVVLCVLIVILIAGLQYIKPLLNPVATQFTANFSLLATAALVAYTTYFLPIIDFRPYKVGNNITELMKEPQNSKPDSVRYELIYQKNGTQQAFDIKKLPDSTWKWQETKTIVLEKRHIDPPIHDFSISSEQGDAFTDVFLEADVAILVISNKIEQANPKALQKINQILTTQDNPNHKIAALTASLPADAKQIAQQNQINYPIYYSDNTTLKTIIRSNPGLVILKKGTVVAQFPATNLPTKDELKILLN